MYFNKLPKFASRSREAYLRLGEGPTASIECPFLIPSLSGKSQSFQHFRNNSAHIITKAVASCTMHVNLCCSSSRLIQKAPTPCSRNSCRLRIKTAHYYSKYRVHASAESEGKKSPPTMLCFNDRSLSPTSLTPHLIPSLPGAQVDASAEKQQKFQSSWDAKDARGDGGNPEADYLYEIGASQNYNINVDHGQNSKNIDYLFTGELLGHKSDIADGSLRGYEFRKFENIVGDYYVSPRFIERVALFITKNYLMELGCFDPQTRIPLILGIWGGKGQGKTFMTELVFKKLGMEVVVMSSGELEHEWAGTPGRMIRERYRKAAEMSKVRGKMTAFLLNDIDAGLGNFANSQATVNRQVVIGTMMNICDNPNQVSTGQDWIENDYVRRTPIIVTGNDLSTVFAPLIRDGRMDKFYWQPTMEDLVGITHQMYKDDGLTENDMATMVRKYPNQSLDFYGALRASLYDQQILEWIEKDVINGDLSEENENLKDMGRRLIMKDNIPVFEPVDLTLEMLYKEGDRLVREQQMVNEMKLSVDYLKHLKNDKGGGSLIGMKG